MIKSKKNQNISVLMANYNKGKYVGEAIASVLNQSFKDWELVIIDDGSTDNSVVEIKKFVSDTRVRLIINSDNQGVIYCQKRLIEESKFEIVAILDSDDVLYPDALEELSTAYQNNPDCGFIYSQFEVCDSVLNVIQQGICKAVRKGRSNLHEYYASAFRTFKKEAYYKTNGYDEETIYAEDRDIVFQLEEKTKVLFIDKVLYKYRRTANSQTTDSIKSQIGNYSCIYAIYKRYKRRENTKIANLNRYQMSNR